MAVGREWVLAGPDLLDDFEPRVVTMRMNRDEPPTGREAARQWDDDPLSLEVEWGARAIGLRGDDQVVIGVGDTTARSHLVEQESVVLAIDDQHDRLLVDRIAAFG